MTQQAPEHITKPSAAKCGAGLIPTPKAPITKPTSQRYSMKRFNRSAISSHPGFNRDQWLEKPPLLFNYGNPNGKPAKDSPTYKNRQRRTSRPPGPLEHLGLMKLRIASWPLSSGPDSDRVVLSHALHL